MTNTTSPTVTHPKREPIFSWSRSEDDSDQRLRVGVVFEDGSRDWEEQVIALAGEWIPSEIEEQHVERLTRILKFRHAERVAGASKKETL